MKQTKENHENNKQIFGVTVIVALFATVTAQAATTYMNGKIQINTDTSVSQYGGLGTANYFTASGFDVTRDGTAGNLPWLVDWNSSNKSTVFSLMAGDTFTFTGHYEVTDKGNPSFGLFLVNANTISGNYATATGFLMNTANGLRTTSGNGMEIAKGGGGWSAYSAMSSPLNNDFTLTHVAANGLTPASLTFSVGGAVYSNLNAPSWENLGIVFRVYVADTSATLTLNNFNYSITHIPEPFTIALLALGGAGLLLALRRGK